MKHRQHWTGADQKRHSNVDDLAGYITKKDLSRKHAKSTRKVSGAELAADLNTRVLDRGINAAKLCWFGF